MSSYKNYEVVLPFDPTTGYINALVERYRLKCDLDNGVSNANCVSLNKWNENGKVHITMTFTFDK